MNPDTAHPFFGPGGSRAGEPEIEARIAKELGTTAVCGFETIIDPGDAVTDDKRMSDFRERGDFTEWVLPLSGKKGLTWKTADVPASTLSRVSFYLAVGFGNGSPLPQPSGQWNVFVNDRLAVSIRVVNHDQLWRGDECSFAFGASRLENAEPFQSLTLSNLITNEAFATFGPAFLTVPVSWLEPGRPARIRLEPVADTDSTRWIMLGPAKGMLWNTNLSAVEALVGGNGRPRVGDFNVYFGDIHTHSGQMMDECKNKGCGWGSREENYRYARGPGGLDFYALTDHEWQNEMDPDRYFELADTYNEDGRFACLPAFEHTNLLYGHRNVYFRESGGTVVSANREGGTPTLDAAKVPAPPELWQRLEETGRTFMTIPHHTSAASHPLNLDFYNPEYDRLFEVYSVWGSSEYYGDFPRGFSDRWRTGDLRDALRRGGRYGLIASSDGHDGHPGNAQSATVKHHHTFHHCGSGRAAVLAPELTREAVFDALHARRCYATTGPPIVLDVNMNGRLMGEESGPLPAGTRPELKISCRGSNGLDHIRIVKDARVVHTVPCHGEFQYELEWEDTTYNTGDPANYYVRVVQKDRESAWSSPIRILA